MKYRVSLLPEVNRKRLNSKKKIERIKIYALIVLVVLLAFLAVVLGTKFYADKTLKEAKTLNNEMAKKVNELEQYREINANLQQKINLINSIQVKEPQLYNFVATLSNLEHPGVSIDTIECTDWKTTRNCILTGTCTTREAYLSFEQAVSEIEGVSVVACSAYEAGVGKDDGLSKFTISISCAGGAAVPTTKATTTASTTEAK